MPVEFITDNFVFMLLAAQVSTLNFRPAFEERANMHAALAVDGIPCWQRHETVGKITDWYQDMDMFFMTDQEA